MSINSRSFTRRLCVGISVVVAAVTGVGLAASAQSTSTAPPIIRRSEVAAAPARFVDIFPTAESTTPAIRLDAFENFSHRLVFSVVEKGSKRIKVLLPIRPNGVTGFVNTADVEVKTYDYFIRVDQSEHSLTVYKDGNPMFVDKVAVGKASTRTPNGRFYLTELAKVKNKGSEYGPYAFGLSAFSDTITRFKSRGGQIGLHGTNAPKALGKNVSHGCIRTSNATITKLANLVPQGTPIDVVP